jgi:hypothetical protein
LKKLHRGIRTKSRDQMRIEDLDEEHSVIIEFKNSLNKYSVEDINHEFERKFNRLAGQWRQETMFMSNANDITSHFAYYQIIGMGPNVVPLILRQVQRGEGHWFLALRALTGENPVIAKDAGTLAKMAKSWLEWGKQRGLIEG